MNIVAGKTSTSASNALNGDGDLDLLVSKSGMQDFQEIIESLGFVEASNLFLSYSSICHYYGLDTQSGAIVHLHVYYELRTGESHTKNYILPWGAELMSGRWTSEKGLVVGDVAWLRHTYLVRHFIKISSLPGLLLYLKEKSDYDDEYRCLFQDLTAIDVDDAKELHLAFKEQKFLRQYVTGVRLKSRFRSQAIRRGLHHMLFRYYQIIYRLLNKLFVRHKKHFLNGAMVAVSGLDGTGKSTTVDNLYDVLGKQFDVVKIHTGRPPGTLLTWPLRIALRIRKQLSRDVGKEDRNVESYIVDEVKTGFIAAIRYLALAYERYRLIQRYQKKVFRGNVVICDRYPTTSIGKMDSPKISQSSNNALIALMSRLELALYHKIPLADLVIQLQVPVEVALERNRARTKEHKETDNELKARHLWNRELDYRGSSVVTVNTEKSIDDTRREVLSHVWGSLVSNNRV